MANESICLILQGLAGYEAEHTARMFFSGLHRAEEVPQDGDCLLISSRPYAHLVPEKDR